MTNLVNVAPDPKAITCDMPVEVVFEKLTDEISCHVPARGTRAMTDLARMRSRRLHLHRRVDESDELGTLPHKSQLSLHVEAVHNAVRDAGLKVSDVDGSSRPASTRRHHRRGVGVTRATSTAPPSRLLLHHHGRPRHGGPPPRPLRRGGDLAWRIGALGRGRDPDGETRLRGAVRDAVRLRGSPDPVRPHHHAAHARVRTTLEQWAQVAVSTRKWAALNPKAKNREPMTVQDVLDSAPWSGPSTS